MNSSRTVSSVYNPSLNIGANLLLADGRLAAIVRQLREDDNPVLYRYYFKKSLFKSPS